VESLCDQLLFPCDPSPALVAPVGLAPPEARGMNQEDPTPIQEHEIHPFASLHRSLVRQGERILAAQGQSEVAPGLGRSSRASN
jgi:hypothetical protein